MRQIKSGNINGNYNQTIQDSQIIGDARVTHFESTVDNSFTQTREEISVYVEVRDGMEIVTDINLGAIDSKDIMDANKVLTNFCIENGFIAEDRRTSEEFDVNCNGEWESYYWKDDDLTLSVEGKNIWPSDITDAADELADNLNP